MSNKCFAIPVNAPAKRNGHYTIKSYGDIYVSYDPETYTIEILQYLGVNILPMELLKDPTLEFYYKALENYEESMRNDKGIEEENNYEGAYN